ncbi:hypothetical protein C2845_PM10G18540 [Panicum miliaceum]|uniref:Reverse transcriptase zinc-binding domain-containing protein n=1 Tax=Panicum miliaceum TaxID=4540 RepID=A0A3L6PB74_PANMI|nr:hypothetical protein C2845_PM10G18540 [Panicum miliaceum]
MGAGNYTTRSLYREMTFGGVRDEPMIDLWGCKVPVKVQIFVWMVFHDRIQATAQLKKRKWRGSDKCKLCDHLETTSHIIFQCSIALFLWIYIKENLNLTTNPLDCDSMYQDLLSALPAKKRKMFFAIFAGAMWTLWKIRNDFVFNDKLLAAPEAAVYKLLANLKNWKILTREEDQPTWKEFMAKLEAGVQR